MRRMQSLDDFAADRLARLDAGAVRRRLSPTERTGGARVIRDGRPLTSFSCNDYFGLAQDPRLKAAAVAAIDRFGTGAAASRLVTGDHPLLSALEARLAAHAGQPAARVFGSGYLANLSIAPVLAGEGDLILLDALSHACMLGGARLSGARTLRFNHNDADHLAALLQSERARARRCLIMTERVFSMDGDLAPLGPISALAEAHDAWLLVDGAHALAAPDPPAPLEMGTLSKGLGSYGGYLAASRPVVELMLSRARGFVYSTALPPASAAAALTALDVLDAEPWRRSRPLTLARRFTQTLGLPDAASAIVPLVVGAAEAALAASARLHAAGFLVAPIRPPTVPEGTARLRFCFSAAHGEAEVDALAAAVADLQAVA